MENINFNQSHLGLMRALSLSSVATNVTNYDKQILDSWILLLVPTLAYQYQYQTSYTDMLVLVQCHTITIAFTEYLLLPFT